MSFSVIGLINTIIFLLYFSFLVNCSFNISHCVAVLHSAAVIGSHSVSWVICFSLVMFALQSKTPLHLEQKSHWTTAENSLWQSENKWIRRREFHRSVVIEACSRQLKYDKSSQPCGRMSDPSDYLCWVTEKLHQLLLNSIWTDRWKHYLTDKESKHV